MLKLVCISDTHEYTPNVNAHGDVLIHAGDLLSAFHKVTADLFVKQIKWLNYLKNAGNFSHVLLTPGNHDLYIEQNTEYAKDICTQYGVTLLINSGIRISGLDFYASPYTQHCGNFAYQLSKQELQHHWDVVLSEPIDILISHDPPHGILDATPSGYHVGSAPTSAAVPLHIFGHAHNSYGIYHTADTLFVNASLVNERRQCVNAPVVVYK